MFAKCSQHDFLEKSNGTPNVRPVFNNFTLIESQNSQTEKRATNGFHLVLLLAHEKALRFKETVEERELP